MEKNWTKEQLQAIETKGANILVSAAAGSGKTAVLIERIIRKILNEDVDIDKLLVVTFTSAAASEMKEKLLDAIYDKIKTNKESRRKLEKQISLINKAQISTIHSFCLNVIKNNFYETTLSANFRVGNTTEIELMKDEAMEKLFDELYENEDEEFIKLLDIYTYYNDDNNLKELILKMYHFINTVPYPEKWLEENIEKYNVKCDNFSDTIWGKIIVDELEENKRDAILTLKKVLAEVEMFDELEKPKKTLQKDIVNLETLSFSNWDEAKEQVEKIAFDAWDKSKKYSEDALYVKDMARDERKNILKDIKDDLKSYFEVGTQEALEEINEMYEVLKVLQMMVLKFTEIFSTLKREKNIVDFSDLEHIALELLVDENGNKTEIAKKYDFEEILIDEYQDSSLIQETILNSVSNNNNIFMVGDVKQSIYGFRQARPDLFLDKYYSYDKVTDAKIDKNSKVQLYKNFRSRKEVLDFVNEIFEAIMGKDLAKIEYNEEEYLNLGKEFEEPKINCETEIIYINNSLEEETNKEETNEEEKEEIDKEKEEKEQKEQEEINKINTITKEDLESTDELVFEAKAIASKIKELKAQGYKNNDIVILLRSNKSKANVYEETLLEEGIMTYSDATTNYLESLEIDTIISLLKIIDNPLQDIPLVTVLRSPIVGFSDNQLLECRMINEGVEYYYALLEYAKISQQAADFIEYLNELKEAQKEMNIDELIWKIYMDTGYYDYVRLMPNGKLRQANLRKLFEKAKEYESISFTGLFNFIQYIEKIGKSSKLEIEEAKVVGENEDVVRIMSIHKSKGLEFPIVFVANMAKQINFKDLTEKVLLNQEYGFGMNYALNSFDYATLAKTAMQLKMKEEIIAEEMRVLYVALTRAKDKLYLVGISKDVNKKIEDMTDKISSYKKYYKYSENQNKITKGLIKKYITYMDWVLLVYYYTNKLSANLNIINLLDLNFDDVKSNRDINIMAREIDEEKYKDIDYKMNWSYGYKDVVDLKSKTSVTELKRLKKEKTIKEKEEINKEEQEEKEKEEEQKEITNALKKLNDLVVEEKTKKELNALEKGTLVHLVLQNLSSDDYISEIEKLNIKDYKKEYLIENKAIFEAYINTDLYKELKYAKEIKKEQCFYMTIKEKGEDVLVQGAIDMYYIDKDDNLVIVDYKTDRNVNEYILKERYKIQLELYKDALERALDRKVDKLVIYSTYLNKEVLL